LLSRIHFIKSNSRNIFFVCWFECDVQVCPITALAYIILIFTIKTVEIEFKRVTIVRIRYLLSYISYFVFCKAPGNINIFLRIFMTGAMTKIKESIVITRIFIYSGYISNVPF
jgi:hypothetical protein